MPARCERIFLARVSRTRNFSPGRNRRGLPLHDAAHILADQLDRSRRNLGVECVDVFYLHNPETQLSEVPPDEFRRRIRAAFMFLESAVAAGKIGAYGLATWNAFREEPKSPGYLSLAAMAEIAREAGGADHHFRFVQLPLNLAMPEALLRPNQIVEGKTMAMVQAARALGITLVSSAALLAGAAHAKSATLYSRCAGIDRTTRSARCNLCGRFRELPRRSSV